MLKKLIVCSLLAPALTFAGTGMSKDEAKLIVTEFAETYKCIEQDYTLMEAAEFDKPCPAVNIIVPMIYENLMKGKWNKKDVMATATGDFNLSFEDTKGLITLGEKEAPLTVVEIVDPQCPFCINFFKTEFKTIKENYIDKGLINYKFKFTHVPYHYQAPLSIEALYCAEEQNSFVELKDLLMADMNKMHKSDILSYASKTKMNQTEFKTCLDSHKYADIVKKGDIYLENSGLETFPYFVIGKQKDSGFETLSNYGEAFFHPHKAEELIEKIEDVLK